MSSPESFDTATEKSAQHDHGNSPIVAWICHHFVVVVVIAMSSALLAVFVHFRSVSNEVTDSSAVRYAASYTAALSSFRTLYTSEVVERVRDAGIDVTHNYHEQEKAIPLPATLSMRLGNTIGDNEHGATARLFSDYPFPWRLKEGGPQTAFERKALKVLRARPDEAFYEFQESEKGRFLNYAVSDRMRQSCVSCHNSHSESPKTDWKVGDVRGVLAVSVPLSGTVSHVNAGMHKLLFVLLAFGAAGTIGLTVVLRRYRLHAEDLAFKNHQLELHQLKLTRAQQCLEEANEVLQKKAVEQHEMRRAALNIMRDTEENRRELERSHAELASLQQAHIETARHAGMAEIATEVLHNVGNVLNSVNVSSNLLAERLKSNRVENLQRAVDLLNEHSEDERYLQDDPKGKRLPEYLDRLSDALCNDRSFLQSETESLGEKIEHIKEIIQVQQTHAIRGGFRETVRLQDVVRSALAVHEASLASHGIKVVMDFEEIEPLETNKHQVIQILVNLIKNAKNAIDEFDGEERRITLRVASIDDDLVQIDVADTGMGISKENIDRIFQHGFTTRKQGHGFGLHSSANGATELGGTLKVFSEGPGMGATFSLRLPAGK